MNSFLFPPFFEGLFCNSTMQQMKYPEGNLNCACILKFHLRDFENHGGKNYLFQQFFLLHQNHFFSNNKTTALQSVEINSRA
jgi:hypothetical protein